MKKAAYRWIITRERYQLSPWNSHNRVGVEGPKNIDLTIKPNHPFRMYDDDGTLVYEGLIGGDYSGFEPLDDFGEPDGGCTRIDYLNNERWETL